MIGMQSDNPNPSDRLEDLGLDLVDLVCDPTPDLVSIVFDNGHARLCPNYVPFINFAGVVYCDSCDVTVDSHDSLRCLNECRRLADGEKLVKGDVPCKCHKLWVIENRVNR